MIHIRGPQTADKLHRGIYSPMGSPTCLGKVPMAYVRTDPETGHHLFRWRPEGCPLKTNRANGLLHCDSEVWEDPADNLRIVGVLPRESPEWKRQYAKA